IAGGAGREGLVVVDRVEVARGARVLDDLGAREALDERLLAGRPDLELAGAQPGVAAHDSTAFSVTMPTLVAVTTSSPRSSRSSVIVSLKRSLPPRLPSFSQVRPARVEARRRIPGRIGWWYSKRCSPCSRRAELPL